MKKLMMILLLAAPVALLAQGTKPATPAQPGKPGEPGKEGARFVPESVFADIIVVTTNSNGNVNTNIRVDFGKEIYDLLTDKDLLQQITAIRSMNFSSVPDAVNYLNSVGFRFVTNYTTNGSLGTDTHILMEKRIVKRGQDPSSTPQRPPQGMEQPGTRPAENPTPQRPSGDGKTKPKG